MIKLDKMRYDKKGCDKRRSESKTKDLSKTER